jgi:hypothetical protein
LKDGRSILFISANGRTFYQLPLTGERKPMALLASEFDKDEPHTSPDEHWVAYNSLESDRWEVYVAAFSVLWRKTTGLESGWLPTAVEEGWEGAVLSDP